MIQRVLIVAGEASGDVHGARVVQEIFRRNPDAEVFGIGGEAMRRAGMEILYPADELSFMGFLEVVRHLPFIAKVRAGLLRKVDELRPQVALLIDYPGFNLRFAPVLKSRGIPIGYYVSPQVWAWAKGRVDRMRGLVDRMFVIFPFEVPIYQATGVPVEFVGHPLLEELEHLDVPVSMEEEKAFRLRHGLDANAPIVALLPGSRVQEVTRILPILLDAMERLRRVRAVAAVVAAATTVPIELYERFIRDNSVPVISGETHELQRIATCAVVASGTATLETALYRTPMVIVYRTSMVTYWIARLFVRIPFIGLVNIAVGRGAVPELVQRDFTAESVAREVELLLSDDSPQASRRKMLAAYDELRSQLGSPGASSRVVDGLETLLRNQR